ncbi:MAG: DUF1836 domain-containing protein [Oscillospiraceae bacterium]|jgi:DNA-binding transcriptional MerR regulator|nr:DUF1836 domain-containing protein [Oscillospiraceae bacterium]
MSYTLPGTTIECAPSGAETLLGSIFLTGGLVLSQVCQLTGLDQYMVQNWVRRGFCPPPVAKKYTQNQFCRIALINLLKDSLRIDRVATLIDAASESIGECELYLAFLRFTEAAEAAPSQQDDALYRLAGDAARKGCGKTVPALVVFYLAAQSAKLRFRAGLRLADVLS